MGESNAIIRYLADKTESALYPKDLQQRAVIDQGMDYAGQHVAVATAKIMSNMYFYKLANIPKDERSLEDGYKFINQYLPALEQQLSSNNYIAGKVLSLADFALLAALDVCEMAQVDLSPYTHLAAWRKNLMSQEFYTKLHKNYEDSFNKVVGNK